MATLSTIAVALGGAGLLLSLAPLMARSSSPVVDTPTQSDRSPEPIKHERPSLRMSRKELLRLAQQRKVGSAAWRARAKKCDFVRALQAQEAN